MAIPVMRRGQCRQAARVALSLVLIVSTSCPAHAADPGAWAPFGYKKEQERRAKEAATNNSSASEKQVRLKFFNQRWDTVLEQVANDCGMTLVAEKFPDGRVTLRNSEAYSKIDAINLLNKQLEPTGFRLSQKGNYLVLLNLHSLRAEFKRPVLPEHPESGKTGSSTREHAPRPNRSIANMARDVSESLNSGQAPSQPTSQPSAIQQVGHTETALPTAEEPSTSIEVQLKYRKAADVALLIYKGHADHAAKIMDGPRGLPGIQVRLKKSTTLRQVNAPHGQSGPIEARMHAAGSDAMLSIGISTDWNMLVVEGPRTKAEGFARLIQWLDDVRPDNDTSIKLVSSEKDVAGIARNLRPQLKYLESSDPRPGTAKSRPFAADQRLAQAQPGQPAFQPNVGQQGDQNGQGVDQAIIAGPRGDVVPLVGGLKGSVTVESLDELGILILRGNEEDVAKVMEVIQEIEARTVGTAPTVKIEPLENVNSLAISGLLNTVYEKLGASATTRPQQGVSVIPIVKPNAVLIIAPEVELNNIVQLIDQLDVPVDPASEFEFFTLENAIANQVVTAISELFPVPTDAAVDGLVARVRAVADARTNSVIVQARPRDLEEIALMIQRLDKTSPAAVNQIRSIPLQNAVAEELSGVINTAIQSVLNPPPPIEGAFGQLGAGGVNSQVLQEVKSAILQFIPSDDPSGRDYRTGVLSDIRVTADPRTNSLLVTAPKPSMDFVVALIHDLDKPTSTIADVKVFPLKNADAFLMTELLTALFAPPETEGLPSVQFSGGSSGVVPVRFEADVRSNSVIAVGSLDALDVVYAILLTLDTSDLRDRRTEVVPLRNSPAVEVAASINAFLDAERELQTLSADLVSPFELLEREVIVVPEEVTNKLIVSTTPRYYERISRIISDLDEVPRQVVIQALLVEVELDDLDEFGVEFGVQDPLLFARSLIDPENTYTLDTTTVSQGGVTTTSQQIISQAGLPGFNFNNTNSALGGNLAANPSRIGTQGLTNLGVGRQNTELGVGGLVIAAQSNSLNFLLRALQSNRRVDVLSRPTIRTLNNVAASIQVGQQVPIVTGVTITDNFVNPNVDQDEAGIILTVRPRISPEGLVVMEVQAEKSAFEGEGVPIFIDAATGNVVESPVKNVTYANTTVAVGNGQTVVIGGMITKTTTNSTRGIPWLMNLPVLGPAFRFDSMDYRRTELLIFLTPRVIGNEADDEFFKQVEIERLHFCEADAEEIHGPLRAVNPADQCFPVESFLYDGFAPGMPDGGPGFPIPVPDEAFPVTTPDAHIEAPPGPGYVPPELPPGGEYPGVPTTMMPAEPALQGPDLANHLEHFPITDAANAALEKEFGELKPASGPTLESAPPDQKKASKGEASRSKSRLPSILKRRS